MIYETQKKRNQPIQNKILLVVTQTTSASLKRSNIFCRCSAETSSSTTPQREHKFIYTFMQQIVKINPISFKI